MSLPASNIDLYVGAVSNLRLVKGTIYEDPHYEMSVTLLSFPPVKIIPPPHFPALQLSHLYRFCMIYFLSSVIHNNAVVDSSSEIKRRVDW